MSGSKPEIIYGMPRAEYDQLQRVNWSTLRLMGRSPAHYRHNLLQRAKDTDAMRLGRARHMATLEPERWLAETAIWDGDRRAGREWERFKAANEGRELLKEDEARACQDIAAAVRSDAVAAKYVTGGRPEVTLLWSDMGLELKARVDFVADCGALADMKTTRDASPEGFGREVWRYSYHVQSAWYSDAYFAVTGKRLKSVLVAVEAEPPHAVAVYVVPARVLELGRERYRALAEHLAFCRSESKWPSYASEEMELELPRWAVDFADDEDVTGLGLVIGGA